jgi:hypothetical protein
MMLNQNRVLYQAPSDDPWMPAHDQYNGSTGPFWLGDYSVNLMGCTDQYQICNPNKGNDPSACTKLLGQFTLMNEVVSLVNTTAFNNHQILTAMRFLGGGFTMSIYSSVESRGASALNGWSIFLGTVYKCSCD